MTGNGVFHLWERELNPAQLEAVTHGDGPQLVIAGAGSGKTRVITYRMAWLVEERGVYADRIAAVTFTNKAAGEMRERVEELLGMDSFGAFVGTFHRFCLVLLRRYGERVGLARDFSIFDTRDQLNLVKQALGDEQLSETSFPPRSVLSSISSAKNQLLDPTQYEDRADDFYTRRVGRVYRRYQGLLAQAAAIDFDDMLFWSVRVLREHEDLLGGYRERIRYLLVDEFQDTNHVQLELVKMLGGESPNLTAVGDEDQGIYRWRGAELDNILAFERHFPGATVRKLEQNYRSTQTILDASGAMVENNESRRGKRLWTEAGEGEPIRVYKAADEADEARWIVRALRQRRYEHALDEMAVLVRTHAQTRVLEEELLRQRVPYVLVGGVRFYDRAEVKDVIAYLRVLRNPRDDYSLSRVVNNPPRGIGKTTLELLREQADARGVTVWDALLQPQVLDDLPARSARALGKFRDLILSLTAEAEHLPLAELLERLLRDSGYLEQLESKGDAESEARLENLQELVSAAQELAEKDPSLSPLDTLTAFLDHVSLVADVDSLRGGEGGVLLMTLHSAKGLEFPLVVVGGLEEGVLPHFNSQGSREDLEEERRLLYVGMTRAMERLFLTCCRRRRVAGRYQDQIESPFLAEIPEDFLEVEEAPRSFDRDRTRGVYSFFGRTEPRPVFPTGEAESASSGSGGLRRGTRVRHGTLGSGTVMEVQGEGEEGRLTIYFERWGKRKLVRKYAKLEILD